MEGRKAIRARRWERDRVLKREALRPQSVSKKLQQEVHGTLLEPKSFV